MARCKKEILEELNSKYDSIVEEVYNGDYLCAVQRFEEIAEKGLRRIMDKYYDKPRSRDQAWRSCKGALYEYAVLRAIEYIVNSDKKLRLELDIIPGIYVKEQPYAKQVVIRNWSDIYPDVDILIVEKKTRLVKAIISCKTSLRERLTETAFWKKELEKFEDKRNIRVIFITTDKDNELKSDTNRYIILHVIDCTFLTDIQKYHELIRYYAKKYGNRNDFNILCSKIKPITDIKDFLYSLLSGSKDGDLS